MSAGAEYLIPPTPSERVPPVHKATGGHGFQHLPTHTNNINTAIYNDQGK